MQTLNLIAQYIGYVVMILLGCGCLAAFCITLRYYIDRKELMDDSDKAVHEAQDIINAFARTV